MVITIIAQDWEFRKSTIRQATIENSSQNADVILMRIVTSCGKLFICYHGKGHGKN